MVKEQNGTKVVRILVTTIDRLAVVQKEYANDLGVYEVSPSQAIDMLIKDRNDGKKNAPKRDETTGQFVSKNAHL
jgi:hypothetical protein